MKETDIDRKSENKASVYFSDLIIENVRCFRKKQTLDLSDGNSRPARWTLILGDNGTGKTTLLKCLTIFDSSNYAARIITGFNPHKNFLNNDDFVIGTTGLYSGSIHCSVMNKSDECYFYGKNLLKKSEMLWRRSEFPDLILYAYGASRRMGTGSLSETRFSHNTASLFYDDIALINAEEWLLQADYAVKRTDKENEPYFENRFNRVKELLIRLLPDAEDIRIRPVTKEQEKPATEVQTPYGWVGIQDLSLGYQTLIAWMTDLANRLFERYPESDNPLAEPAVVLVDEIDLHLHPKWQRLLIRHITDIFTQTQFIVTAHSPLIVQSARNANIVLLKREGDQVIIYNNKDEDIIKGWRLDQVVTSDLFDLPTARPPEYDEIIEERERILAKPKLSQEDEQRLEDIGRKLEELPFVTENKEDSEAMELIRKAARMLKDKVK